jgi:hypothetical protein
VSRERLRTPTITTTLRLSNGEVTVPGGPVWLVRGGRVAHTGEVVRVNTRTVTVRFYNLDRTYWEGRYPPSRLRKVTTQ